MGQAAAQPQGRGRERSVAVRRTAAALGAFGAVLSVLALGGCGFDVGSPPGAVKLVISRDFGSRVLRSTGALRTSGGESVLELLRHSATVGTGPGGRRVQAIEGVPSHAEAGAEPGGEWLYYVNGVQAAKGPAATGVQAGDHIWWDLHDPGQSRHISAVVGAFPEPFLNGYEGRRLPVRIECASASRACRTVTASLRAAGVPAAIAAIGSGGAPETLRVMVGPWSHLNGDLEAESIGNGPRESGVYARFSARGRVLTLLDERGEAVRTLSGAAGLVAATKGVKEAPVWVITGTDDAGVELAARAFNRSALEDRFAVALAPGGAIALPAPAASRR
jgi:hypothetical protein